MSEQDMWRELGSLRDKYRRLEAKAVRLKRRAERAEAEAGAMREALVGAYVFVGEGESLLVPAVKRGIDAALSTDAGRRTLAQIEAGRALAEAVEALRSRLKTFSARMDGRHVYAIQNAPTFYEQVHALDASLAAWDRAQEGGVK